jgi:phosphoenolpyruvate synthase/pyruvate phosphate dikinase
MFIKQNEFLLIVVKNGSPIYTDEEIIELARIGKTIERHQGTPQDIGLAIDKDLSFPLNIFKEN